jgi:serine/threonine-protein kinase
LSDANKAVRREALNGLAKAGGEIDIGAVTAMLRDPDLTIQSQAIEVITTANHPDSMGYLLDVLQDESEYVRRAAVEVLNEIGNPSTIKDLLDALRDKDWWVRVRAADALGTIGGPKVVEATLSLLRDEDEFIRRSAIEILNTTKDDRALNALIDALADPDWWVRERAVDALAELGNREAVPALIGLLNEHPEGSPVIINALIRFGDASTVLPLLSHLDIEREEQAAQILGILSNCTDGDQVEAVMQSLRALLEQADGRILDLTKQTLESLSSRFAKRPAPCTPTPVTSDVRPTRVLSCLDPRDSAQSTVADVTDSGRPVASPAADAAAATATTIISDPTALTAGTVVGDRYRVIRHIEGGAFGVVVLVEDIVLNEEVILKFLRPHVASDPKVISRFMQELRCARKISHENVIRIHDFLLLGNAYAISMEYFPSQPLSAEIERCGTIEPMRALQIASDTCAGMIVAHGADIVHRDLKPANVLINDHDQVKIVDFGLAAAASFAGTRITTAGMAVGTPTYMSPEQIRGHEFDARTDIYSLAVILYEMLTGRPPYTGPDPISILYQHLEGKFVRPRERVPSIPQSVEAVIIKAMATEPEARYQSVLELRQAIEGRLTKGAA